jgi:hypothetical protein
MEIPQIPWWSYHHFFAHVAVHDRGKLGKQRLGWNFRTALLNEIAGQRSRHVEDKFLHAEVRAAFVQRNLIYPARPKE